MQPYDVVVIGAGNAGLTAAAMLSQKGMNVLLLERHNIPGGSATSFCRGRFEFEVALHQLSGIGTPEKPGPLRSTLDQLGVMGDLEFVPMTDLYRVVIGDQIDVSDDRKFIGFDAYKAAIDVLRPGDVAMCTTRAYIRPVHVEYAVQKGINVFMEKL